MSNLSQSRINKDFFQLSLIVIIIFYAVIMLFSLQNHYFNNDDFYYLGRADKIFEEPLSIFLPSRLSRLHPVFILFLAFQYLMFGIKPFGYYVILTLLHIINSYLIYKLFIKLNYDKVAVFFACLLFLTSSLHFQAVTWIACQATVLSTTFFILGILIFINYRTNNIRRIPFSLILLYFLGILIFENIITLPFVLLAYDLIYSRKIFFKNRKIIFAHLTLITMAILFTFTIYKLGGTQAHRLSLGKHLLQNILFSFPREVLQALLVPRKEFISHIPFPAFLIRILPYLFLIILVVIVSNRKSMIIFKKENRLFLIFPLLLILITILPSALRPMSGIWQVRYLYIPLIGAYILGGIFFQFLFHCISSKYKNRIVPELFLILIILYSLFLNIKTLIFLSDKMHLEARWSDPPEQNIMISSVIPQIKQIYPCIPKSSPLLLENMPVHGICLRAIMDFYYQEDLKIIEIEDISREKMEVREPYYYFKLINGKLVNYSKVE